MSQCRIYLENYGGTYYSSSDVKGKVECYFEEETKVRGIKIRLICKEHNEWGDTEEYLDTVDNKYKSRYVTYTGDHDVVFLEQMLYGSGGGPVNISMGQHVYPFCFTLPEKIPSTYKGPYGNIGYKLKAIVDRPMKTDFEDEFNFIVNSPIDFNFLPDELQQPSFYSDDKTVCCWCCKGGNLNADVELQKAAIVHGEPVNLRVTITNLSNQTVGKLQVQLIKTLKFHVQSPSSAEKEQSDNILSLIEHGVGAHGEHTYDLKIDVPNHTEIPNFTGCNLFSVKYTLTVTCKMPSCTTDLDIYIYPKLGHIQKSGSLPAYPLMNQPIATVPGFPYPSGPTAPGFYPPFDPPYTEYEEKPVYPPAPPTAPYKGGEMSQPSAPELPPPSYDQIEKFPKN